ncbi:hypothetical protein [Priestia sp. TGN 0903]|uniref:hypothetical protein n=1 Tax=Priestia sp. TGN 0903 TaxID=3420730 RepID=UPI003D76DD05
MIKRKIRYDIDTDSWTIRGLKIPTKLQLQSIIDIDILEVLIHIAKRTSLPVSFGFNLGDLWAWLRYLPAISPSPYLRMRSEWDEVDSHQKTILSDDMGVGFSSSILSRSLDLIFICPTNYVVKRHPSLALSKSGKRGPDKSPDFVAVDMLGNLHVIECKGTQSSPNVLNNQLDAGFIQKHSLLDPKGIIDQRIVSGVFVPQHNSKETAIFKVADPEYQLNFSFVTKNEIIDTIILGEISSSLRLLGFSKFANTLACNNKINSRDLKNFKTEITELESHKINGILYKKASTLYRFDNIFANDAPQGLRIQIGLKEEFINKLFTILENSEHLEPGEPLDIAKQIRNKIQHQTLRGNTNESGPKWTSIESPLGLFIKFELEN